MLKYFTGKTPISSSSTLGFKEGEPVETPFGHIQSYKWYNGSSKAGDTQVSIFKFTTNNHDNPGNSIQKEVTSHIRAKFRSGVC